MFHNICFYLSTVIISHCLLLYVPLWCPIFNCVSKGKQHCVNCLNAAPLYSSKTGFQRLLGTTPPWGDTVIYLAVCTSHVKASSSLLNFLV